MKRSTLFVLVALLLISFNTVYAAGAKQAKSGASKDSNDSGLLTAGDFGFKFYTGYPYSGGIYYNGNNATFFRTIGVGADWHITSSFALEPGFFYYYNNKTTKVSGITKKTEDQYYGPSLGLFYYYNAVNNLFIYSGPRFEYAYHEGNTKDPSSATLFKTKQRDHYLGGVAVLGLKYMFNNNFGIFGETGLGYFMHKGNQKNYATDGTIAETKTTEKEISLTSAYFGVALYL